MNAHSRSEWRQESRLLGERDRLGRLLEELRVAVTSRAGYEPHDVIDDEAATHAVAIEGRLAAIDKALDRIDSGTYGVCLTCESPIVAERLEALPTAALCGSCAG